MIYPGGNTVQRAFRGNTPIGSVWVGDKLVYPDGPSFQAYKWLSGYHDSAHIYNGYMEISTPQTDHIFQPRQSLLQGNSALDGTWVSTYNDGANWMAGAATAARASGAANRAAKAKRRIQILLAQTPRLVVAGAWGGAFGPRDLNAG